VERYWRHCVEPQALPPGNVPVRSRPPTMEMSMSTMTMSRAVSSWLLLMVAFGLAIPTARAARPRGVRLNERIERLERRADAEATLAAAAAAAPGPVPRVWRPRAAIRAGIPPAAAPAPGAPTAAPAPVAQATPRTAPPRAALPPASRPAPAAARPAQVIAPQPRVPAPAARPLPTTPPAPEFEPADDGTRSVLVGGDRPAASAPPAAGPTPAEAPIELLPTP
jgi:hypothetical protein